MAAHPPGERSPASQRGFAAFAPDASVRLCPSGILDGASAAAAVEQGRAVPLAGGPLAFTEVEALTRVSGGAVSAHGTLADLLHWAAEQGAEAGERVATQLAAIIAVRRPWAGLALDRPRVMGIVNVTPDSFSDGGEFADPMQAIEHGRALLAAGADIIDVGGESTRPCATPVSPDEEIRRVEPVVRALAEAGAVVSIDTRHAAVMGAALGMGARIINDVTALAGDPESLAIVSTNRQCSVILMHMRGDPTMMQEAPSYEHPALDVLDFLDDRIRACREAGISPDRVAVDPGIGFGKTVGHNCAVLARLALFHATGCGVVLGASRKSFIARLGGGGGARERLGGSLAAALWAASQGVQILRVHDVAETRQALAIRQAIVGGVP